MNGRGTRVARGLVAAGIATFVAGFSHVAAGGGAPGGVGLALALAFAAVVCVLLTRRALSLPLLAVSVVVSQFAFHLLFEVGNGGGAPLGISPEHAGHHVTAGGGAALLAASGTPTAASTHLHDSGWMWVAHAVAALATIALLHRGERMLRHLLFLARTPLRIGLRGARIRLVAVVALLVPAAAREVLERLRDGVRLALEAARVGVVDRLAECGVVFTRLRHRGPPALRAALTSV